MKRWVIVEQHLVQGVDLDEALERWSEHEVVQSDVVDAFEFRGES